MSFDAHANLAISAVADPSPGSSGTALTVLPGHGVRFPAPPFNVTIWETGRLPTPLTAEVARVTAIVGDVLTISRAAEPPAPPRTILVGDLIAETITAKALADIESGLNFPLITTPGALTAGGDLVFTGDPGVIRTDTLPGADTHRVFIGAGGAANDPSRGAFIGLAGNQFTGTAGWLVLASGFNPASVITFAPGGVDQGRMFADGGFSWGNLPDPGPQNLIVSGRMHSQGDFSTGGWVDAQGPLRTHTGTVEFPVQASLIRSASGTPEGVVDAGVGSLFLRTNGGGGTTLYVKETGGTGNTGWTPMVSSGSSLLGTDNTFTGINVFTQDLTVREATPNLFLIETDQPANQRNWQIGSETQVLKISATDDAFNAAPVLMLTRAGAAQVTGGLTLGDHLRINRAAPLLFLNDTAQAADLRLFRIVNAGQLVAIQPCLDNGNATPGNEAVTINRAGDLEVRGKATVVGTTGNVACKDQANVFTANQTLQKAAPLLKWFDTSGVANQRSFACYATGEKFFLDSLNDAGATVVSILSINHTGGLALGGALTLSASITERARTVPLGEWIDVPYNAANFTTDVGTWTVEPGDIQTYAYTLVGKTLILAFALFTTSVAGTPVELRIALPGFTVARRSRQPFFSVAAIPALAAANVPNGYVSLFTDPSGTPWANATNTANMQGQIVINIA